MIIADFPAVISLACLMVAFKSQKQIGGSGFTSWRCYSVILTFRSGVSVLLREWEMKTLTSMKLSFIKLCFPFQSINGLGTVASVWKSLLESLKLLCYKNVSGN